MRNLRSRSGLFRTRPGVALLLTLAMVGLLTASALSFIRMTHIEAKLADNQLAFTQAEILAQAGLKGAMSVLAMDDPDFDALTDPWAGFERYAALASGLFDEGEFTGRIEDLSARFNLNFLIDHQGLVDMARLAQLQRLFALMEIDPAPIPALLDWLDGDEEPRLQGAENPYYLSLARPYPCGNGPLVTIGQLTLVKGFGPHELFGAEGRPGLAEVITVHSDGKININTAGEKVLMSLDNDLTAGVAREIMERRAFRPFEHLEEIRQISGLDPKAQSRLVGLISVTGSHFLIRVEGRFRQAKAPLTAIVERSGHGVRLVYYRAG